MTNKYDLNDTIIRPKSSLIMNLVLYENIQKKVFEKLYSVIIPNLGDYGLRYPTYVHPDY